MRIGPWPSPSRAWQPEQDNRGEPMRSWFQNVTSPDTFGIPAKNDVSRCQWVLNDEEPTEVTHSNYGKGKS